MRAGIHRVIHVEGNWPLVLLSIWHSDSYDLFPYYSEPVVEINKRGAVKEPGAGDSNLCGRDFRAC